jgi:hypothetical protein
MDDPRSPAGVLAREVVPRRVERLDLTPGVELDGELS